ncbi:hypothetical protein [Citrobacter amalonaticus]|uniref:hypothetical protein n=1 Tax=Citrobacter amalonaticus TaxID=35703 RepID=UPI001F18BC7E|nr:hypothetical protein [Citrobacter amalonaticus]
MNRTDAPAKQSKPFGINGQREPILPTTPSGDNTASYESGFPAITMTLKSAGGLPPKGQDMNQILYELSALGRWSSTGSLNSYDSAFSTAIGGYPSGSILLSDDALNIYINTVDGNTTNPNSGGAGWKTLIEYLNLASGAPAIGVPFFWPSASLPNTVIPEWSNMVFMKFNGASFSATTYPHLALVFPSLVIPEARGEFLRTWDDGRGVDSGRDLLSAQGDAIRNITGSFGGTTNNDTCSVLGQGAGVFANGTSLVNPTNGSVIGSATRPVTMTLDASRQVPTASENRSRNIAFNFLVRAK